MNEAASIRKNDIFLFPITSQESRNHADMISNFAPAEKHESPEDPARYNRLMKCWWNKLFGIVGGTGKYGGGEGRPISFSTV